MSPWKVDDPDRPEIPLHPNCMCEWRPRLKSDDEILAAFKEEMAEELGIIEGTEEQADMLEHIERQERRDIELVIPSAEIEQLRMDDLFNPLADDKTPAKIINRNPDYSSESIETASVKELNELLKLTRDSNHEHMSIITGNMKVARTLEGSYNKINIDNITNIILEKSPDNSITMFQTHTNKTSLSVDDFFVLNNHNSIKDFHHTNIDGKNHYANIGAGQRKLDFNIINDKSEEIKSLLLNDPKYAIFYDIDNYEIDELNILFADFIHDRNTRLANHFGWIYY